MSFSVLTMKMLISLFIDLNLLLFMLVLPLLTIEDVFFRLRLNSVQSFFLLPLSELANIESIITNTIASAPNPISFLILPSKKDSLC